MLFLSTSRPPKISNSRGTKFCSFIQRPPPYNVCSLIRCTLLRGLGLDLNIHHISLKTNGEVLIFPFTIFNRLFTSDIAPGAGPKRSSVFCLGSREAACLTPGRIGGYKVCCPVAG